MMPAAQHHEHPYKYDDVVREGQTGIILPESPQYHYVPLFEAWPKTPRLFRDMIVTEKLDGTNGCIIFGEDGQVYAQSRKKLLIACPDNYGFRAWVEGNRETLFEDLGPGRHYGEWWGKGIQRGYGIEDRRFSLFNTSLFASDFTTPNLRVVPVIDQYTFDTSAVQQAVASLRTDGSLAAPGYMSPEGVCVFHTASRSVFKVLLENDELPKGLAA